MLFRLDRARAICHGARACFGGDKLSCRLAGFLKPVEQMPSELGARILAYWPARRSEFVYAFHNRLASLYRAFSLGGSVMMTARNAVPVTPHDTNPIAPTPGFLYVGGAGNVKLRAKGSNVDVVMTAVAGGYLLVQAQYVYATGTTATGIVGLT
jgi:hypothetical protein